MNRILRSFIQIVIYMCILFVIYQGVVTLTIIGTNIVTSQSSINTVIFGKEETINQIKKFIEVLLFSVCIVFILRKLTKSKEREDTLLEKYMDSLKRNTPIEQDIDDIIEEQRKKIIQNKILKEIKINNSNFNHIDFLYGSSHLCEKILYANEKIKLNKLKDFETSKLYKRQLIKIKNNEKKNLKNINEDVKIISTKILKYDTTDKIDIIYVKISAEMINYEIDIRTNDLISGDKEKEIYKSYILIFAKKLEKFNKKSEEINEQINCPSCGAPIEIDVIGKCLYCGNYTRTEKFNWKIADVKEI